MSQPICWQKMERIFGTRKIVMLSVIIFILFLSKGIAGQRGKLTTNANGTKVWEDEEHDWQAEVPDCGETPGVEYKGMSNLQHVWMPDKNVTWARAFKLCQYNLSNHFYPQSDPPCPRKWKFLMIFMSGDMVPSLGKYFGSGMDIWSNQRTCAEQKQPNDSAEPRIASAELDNVECCFLHVWNEEKGRHNEVDFDKPVSCKLERQAICQADGRKAARMGK